MQNKGASTEESLANREKKENFFFQREQTSKSWQWKRTCNSFCTAAQEQLSQCQLPPRQKEVSTAEVCTQTKPAHISYES